MKILFFQIIIDDIFHINYHIVIFVSIGIRKDFLPDLIFLGEEILDLFLNLILRLIWPGIFHRIGKIRGKRESHLLYKNMRSN